MVDEKTKLGLPKKEDTAVNVRETHEDAAVKGALDNTHASDARLLFGSKELDDAEFAARLNSGLLMDSTMPPPPEVEGYTTSWGTTMQDSQNQLRWMLSNGYSFVTLEDAPNYRNMSPRAGSIEGVVNYNELVALKFKKGRKEMLAKKFHHDMPLALEASIKNEQPRVSDAKYQAKIMLEDGMREMGQAPRKTPSFSV